MSNAGKTLVLGASGYIGSHLVPALHRRGVPVRAGARRVEELEWRFGDMAEAVRLDLLEPESLPPALDGVDCIYYLVHSMQQGDDFAARDLRAARILADAAAKAGVQRIIYLGAALPPGTRSEHLLSRQQTGEALRQGSVQVLELRAPVIIGPGSAPFETIRDLVDHLPGTPLPMAAQRTSAPIALSNLLFYLVELGRLDTPENLVLLAAGPESISYQQQLQRYARVVGKRFFSFRVPGLTAGLVKLLIPVFTSAPAGVIRALLSGLEQDMPDDARELQQRIPQRLLGYEAAIREALALEQKHDDPLYWYQGNTRFREGWPNAAFYGDRLVIQRETALPPAALWRVLSRIGGSQRYFYRNWVWAIREWLDAAVGGPGRQLGRDHSETLKTGERVDSWVILDVVEQRRVLLGFRMKGPGSGNLEFSLEPLAGGGTRLSMRAYWHPAGLWGQLYWYTMMRPHTLLFQGMLRRIEALAAAEEGLVVPRLSS